MVQVLPHRPFLKRQRVIKSVIIERSLRHIYPTVSAKITPNINHTQVAIVQQRELVGLLHWVRFLQTQCPCIHLVMSRGRCFPLKKSVILPFELHTIK